MKRLVLESTAPFQGLPELVAFDEGLDPHDPDVEKWARKRMKRLAKSLPDGGQASNIGRPPMPVNGQVEVPTGGHEKSPPRGTGSGGWWVASSSRSGFLHAERFAFGDDDGGVVQQPVQHGDGGGVFG